MAKRSKRETAAQRKLTNRLTEWGWVWWHPLPGLTPDGRWLTACEGRAGFPDLVAVRGRRLVFIEVKVKGGRLSPKQRSWVEDLSGTCAEMYVWHLPRDLDVAERLMGPTARDRRSSVR